jgi:hypothetical protein
VPTKIAIDAIDNDGATHVFCNPGHTSRHASLKLCENGSRSQPKVTEQLNSRTTQPQKRALRGGALVQLAGMQSLTSIFCAALHNHASDARKGRVTFASVVELSAVVNESLTDADALVDPVPVVVSEATVVVLVVVSCACATPMSKANQRQSHTATTRLEHERAAQQNSKVTQ